MSRKSLVNAHAAASLAADLAVSSAKSAIAALADASQARVLLGMALQEAQSQIEQHNLQDAQVACNELDLFITRIQLALEALGPKEEIKPIFGK